MKGKEPSFAGGRGGRMLVHAVVGHFENSACSFVWWHSDDGENREEKSVLKFQSH